MRGVKSKSFAHFITPSSNLRLRQARRSTPQSLQFRIFAQPPITNALSHERQKHWPPRHAPQLHNFIIPFRQSSEPDFQYQAAPRRISSESKALIIFLLSVLHRACSLGTRPQRAVGSVLEARSIGGENYGYSCLFAGKFISCRIFS